jgi:predicted TPR repeat methyltransferase
VRTKEFWDQVTATEVLPFLGEVTALVGRARRAAERLYCWICL